MTAAAARANTILEVARDQAGLLTRAQLRRLGVDSGAVRDHVHAGRWRALSRRVVALQTGPLSDEQVAWFAVLDGGDDCALAGLSALHSHGLRGFPVDRLQAAVPLAGKPGRHDLFVRRRSRRMSAAAIHPVRRPPVQRLDVAVGDALAHIGPPLRGCALLAALVQQRLMRADRLRPLVGAELTLPGRGLYLAVAGDIEGGAHSLLEIDFFALARRAGIPPPVGQSVRIDRSGRRRYLDADFGGFAAEVDGAIHLRPLAWWDDMWRLNDIVIGGKPTLRFPSVGIRLQPERAIEQLQQAAARWL